MTQSRAFFTSQQLDQFVSARRYGAIPGAAAAVNGPAFQAAITDAGTTKYLFIEPGTYNITGYALNFVNVNVYCPGAVIFTGGTVSNLEETTDYNRRINGVLTLATPPGSTDGGILRFVNPLDGQAVDFIEGGPEQDFLLGPSAKPYAISFRQSINSDVGHFVDRWDTADAAPSNYPQERISYVVEDLGAGVDIAARAVAVAPYAVTFQDSAQAIYEANSAGIGAAPNDAVITIRNITTATDIATVTLVADVAANGKTAIPLISAAAAIISSGDVIGIVVTQGPAADLPKFTIQFSYIRQSPGYDQNWVEVTSGLTAASYVETSGSKCLRLTTRSNNLDNKIVYRPGFIVQGTGQWNMRLAFAEARDTGNTDPGNKTLAFGYSDTPTDPLAVTSKTICMYRTNNDGTGFGTWQIRVIDGAAATDTPLDDVSVKTGEYGGFRIHHLEYVPTDGVAYAWVGNSSNYFNKDNSGVADAQASVSAAAFTSSVRMKPFIYQRVEQAAGVVGFQYTTIKYVAGVRWHF